MDPTALALLVAGIPAAVAALTFLVSEVLKTRRVRDEQIAASITALARATARIAVVEDRPRWFRRWQQTEAITNASAAAIELLASMRRPDKVVAYWIIMSSPAVLESQEDRVTWAAKVAAELRVWQLDPRRSRRAATEQLGRVPIALLPWWRRVIHR